MHLNVDLQLAGPMTADLWKLVAGSDDNTHRVYTGSGRTRLEATMHAASAMRAAVKPKNRKLAAEWTQHALEHLRRATNDPSRAESHVELGTAMYAQIWVGPLGPSQEL